MQLAKNDVNGDDDDMQLSRINVNGNDIDMHLSRKSMFDEDKSNPEQNFHTLAAKHVPHLWGKFLRPFQSPHRPPLADKLILA